MLDNCDNEGVTARIPWKPLHLDGVTDAAASITCGGCHGPNTVEVITYRGDPMSLVQSYACRRASVLLRTRHPGKVQKVHPQQELEFRIRTSQGHELSRSLVGFCRLDS